jgi:DNA-binding NtrC family response regulator
MLRVLLVDDNRNFRTSLTIGLRREGFVVESSGNPVEAYSLIQERLFDALLTDLRMPYISGFELAKLAKRQQPKLIVVLLSAYDFKDVLSDPAGTRDFMRLSKPFDMQDLLALLYHSKQVENKEPLLIHQ